MEYILVLQLPGSSPEHYDELIQLEEVIQGGIGDAGVVDGHDIGVDERNIFLYTANPRLAFERIKSLFEARALIGSLKAAYRKVGEDEFTVIHPDGLKSFTIT